MPTPLPLLLPLRASLKQAALRSAAAALIACALFITTNTTHSAEPELGMGLRSSNSASETSSATPSAPIPASVPKDYRLGASDVLSVRVFQQQDLDATVRLSKNGTATLPLIGEIKLVGMTLGDATRAVEAAYAKDYLVNPQVTVAILEYAKFSFSIMGHVMRPGNYDLPPDRVLNLTQALGMAGGCTKDADASQVVINRNVGGQEKSFTVDASLSSRTREAESFRILPNDTVVINYGSRMVSILGQVMKPGYCEIPQGGKITLVEALTLVGGTTGDADLAHVEVRRVVEGENKVFTVDASGGAQDQSGFPVMPGDVVTVPYSNRTFLVLGQVVKPGIYQLPGTGKLSIVKALAMAGGFTRLASRTVTVKRKTGGQDLILKVDVTAQSISKSAALFEVLPEDTISVGESLF